MRSEAEDLMEQLQAAVVAVEQAQGELDDARASGAGSAAVIEAQDRLDEAEKALADLRQEGIDAEADEADNELDNEIEQGVPGLVYANAADWVENYLLEMWRPGPSGKWCRRWWLHPEATTRIEALWRSWEALRLDGPTGMSTWLRDHYDPHMDRLSASGGVLGLCDHTTGEHKQQKLREVESPPPGFFDG